MDAGPVSLFAPEGMRRRPDSVPLQGFGPSMVISTVDGDFLEGILFVTANISIIEIDIANTV